MNTDGALIIKLFPVDHPVIKLKSILLISFISSIITVCLWTRVLLPPFTFAWALGIVRLA